MIIRWLRTGGRGSVVLAVAAIELALAWLLALAATGPFVGVLSHHPQGAFAVYAKGGRLLGDLLAARPGTLTTAGPMAGVLLLLYAGAWMLLGGMFPVMAATPGVRWHRAAAESLRRAPSVLGLAVIAGMGFALAAFAGHLATGQALRDASTRVDVRAVTLLEGAGWSLAALMAGAIALWHDVARVHAMARGKTAIEASGAAWLQMLREPVATVAAGAGFALAGWSAVAVAALLGGLVERSTGGAAMATLLASQHLAVVWRVHARMKWFVWLGARQAERRA